MVFLRDLSPRPKKKSYILEQMSRSLDIRSRKLRLL
jgi:hypothetical protein